VKRSGDWANLLIEKIRLDGGAQLRVGGLDEATVADYTVSVKANAKLPEPTVYFDGNDYWPSGGFHRLEARRRAGKKDIVVEVRQGTRADALLAACAENAAHGLRRSNADKRRAIETCLRHPDSSGWTDRKVAAHVGVDHGTVAAVKAELRGAASEQSSEVAAPRVAKSPRDGAKGGQHREPADAVPEESPPAGDKGDEGATGTVAIEAREPVAPDEPPIEMHGIAADEDWLTCVGRACNDIDALSVKLTTLVGEAGRIFAEDQVRQAARQAVQQAGAAVRALRPHMVCVYCQTKRIGFDEERAKSCTACGGLAWLTHEQAQRVPPAQLAPDAEPIVKLSQMARLEAAIGLVGDGRATPQDALAAVDRGWPAPPNPPRRRQLQIQDGEGRDLSVDRDEDATAETEAEGF
jgi:hypothetical protein